MDAGRLSRIGISNDGIGIAQFVALDAVEPEIAVLHDRDEVVHPPPGQGVGGGPGTP
jgi:hypothetical protein